MLQHFSPVRGNHALPRRYACNGPQHFARFDTGTPTPNPTCSLLLMQLAFCDPHVPLRVACCSSVCPSGVLEFVEREDKFEDPRSTTRKTTRDTLRQGTQLGSATARIRITRKDGPHKDSWFNVNVARLL